MPGHTEKEKTKSKPPMAKKKASTKRSKKK